MYRPPMSVFAVALVAVATSAFAGKVAVGPFSINLPPTFTGPIRTAPDANSEIVVYSSPRNPGEASNVIQFTRFAFGSALANGDENTYAAGAKTYLQQMLQGIEGRRTEYIQSPVTRIHVAVHDGARATWSGQMNGLPTNGVMYCVINGRDAWFIHAFGPGERPDNELQATLAAINVAIK